MSGAGEALLAAAIGVLNEVPGLGGVYPGPPLQAAVPYAVADAGFESDWGHKGGRGREVRLAVTLWDKGEQPGRLRGLVDAAESALDELGGPIGVWRLVAMQFLRTRIVRDGSAKSGSTWAGVIEFRARMLAIED